MLIPRTEPALRPPRHPYRHPHRPLPACRHGRATVLLALAAGALAVGLAAACASRPPAQPPGAVAGTPAPSGTASGAPAATLSAGVEARATATSAPAATPAATASPTATPRPAFTVEIDPPSVGRGETLLVLVTGATAGTVTVDGRVLPLFAASFPGSNGAWAVAGVGLYAGLGPASLTVAARDAQGAAAGEVTATYTIVELNRPADYLELTGEQAAILTPEAAAGESRMRGEQFATFDPMPRWRTAFRHPLTVLDVTTPFGSGRSINGGPVGDFHSGEDLAADEGTPVTAAAPGRVAWVGAMPIRGHSVIVDHGGGVLTGYHHLRDTSVAVGQPIDAGALVGHVGSTGLSTGPHLHWELTIYGVNVDPETWAKRLFAR